MENWKKVLLKFAGFGGGFAFVGAIILGVALWWIYRPTKPKPWNTSAIVATYSFVSLDSDSNFTFYYDLKNNTDKDYVVETYTTVDVEGRVDKGTLLGCTDCVELKKPISIPAGETLQAQLTLKHKYPYDTHPTTDDARHALHKAEEEYLKTEFERLNGFVIFDKNARYKIELPGGWR